MASGGDKIGYDKYTKDTRPADASELEAIESNEAISPSGLLAHFISELKYFSPRPDARQSGPSGMPLAGGFQVEKLNPIHQFAPHLDAGEKAKLEKAKQLVLDYLAIVGDKANSINFQAWLQTQHSENSKIVLDLVESWKKLTPADIAQMQDSVNYLDMVMRQRYVIEPGIDGLLYCRKPDPVLFRFSQEQFDTASSTAAYGGRSGKAIWVQGPSGRFYSSTESKMGKFHHSSFLAGREVKAAGDWEVDHGRLKTISAVSGHYRPPLEALLEALHDLKATSHQLLEWGAVVEAYKDHQPVSVPVKEFLEKSSGDPNYLKQFAPVA